jgi:LysR family transcriptional regulator for bpeEF and oprC
MDRLDAITLFVRVVESGSFSAVARQRGVGQPAISKQIAALEAHLGAQLIRRTSRSLSLTEAGQDFYKSAVRLIEDLDSVTARVGHGQSEPRGLVRVSLAPVFGRLYLVPRLRGFFDRFPAITVDLVVSDRPVNLIEEAVDLAIHNGALRDSSLTSRRIATTPIVTVATPELLERHGEPATPGELERFPCISYAPLGSPRAWGFKGRSGAIEVQPKGNFRTNDAEQIRAAVLAGLGLAHAPGWLFGREIASGSVRLVLRDFEPDPLPIFAVHSGGRRLAGKVRVFIAFLSEALADAPGHAVRDVVPPPSAVVA